MDLILIHGMGRTPLSMMRLRRRLRRRGHHPILFGYSPTFETLQGATARLIRLIERRIGSRPYALIGHSLGTVIIRMALGQLENRAPSACFFLAPPILACKAARYFSRFWLYRTLTGEMGQLLARDAFMRQLAMPAVPTRIYVGVRGPRVTWLPFGMEANDGILSAVEASGDFKSMVLEVSSMHTFIMNAKQVFDDLAQSLETIEQAAASRTENRQENPMHLPPHGPGVPGSSCSENHSHMNENWYDRHLLPHLLDFACGMKPVRRQREIIVPQARGRVLEVGIGTGLNMPFYDKSRVRYILGVDPALQMHRLAAKRIARTGLEVELIGVTAETLPLEAGSIDTVLSTYTLCTIPDPVTALREMRRVLAPGGRLLFCEHGRAPDESVRRWQDRLQPHWQKIAGGCHLGRDIPALLETAGFRCRAVQTRYLPGPRPFTYNYLGEAVPT